MKTTTAAAKFLSLRVSALRTELSETARDPRPVARAMERALRRDLLELETRLAEVI
jgi:hypothetical protein